MHHACTCCGIDLPGVSRPCEGCLANDETVRSAETTQAPTHGLLPLGAVTPGPELTATLARQRQLLDHQAQAVERAMVSFRRDVGTNERLIGTDYESMVLKIPRRDFLARVVIREVA